MLNLRLSVLSIPECATVTGQIVGGHHRCCVGRYLQGWDGRELTTVVELDTPLVGLLVHHLGEELAAVV